MCSSKRRLAEESAITSCVRACEKCGIHQFECRDIVFPTEWDVISVASVYDQTNCMSLLITPFTSPVFQPVSCSMEHTRFVACLRHYRQDLPVQYQLQLEANTCGVGQFQCNDKSCILDIFICDGVVHCSDMSDEILDTCYKSNLIEK